MPRKKENTPMREIRRRYEEAHREERRQNRMNWQTYISREEGEKINAYLQKLNMTKVDFLLEGYRLIKKEMDEIEEERRKRDLTDTEGNA